MVTYLVHVNLRQGCRWRRGSSGCNGNTVIGLFNLLVQANGERRVVSKLTLLWLLGMVTVKLFWI